MKMSISTAIEERTEGDDDTSQESQTKDDQSDLEDEMEHENGNNIDNNIENDNGPQDLNGGSVSPEVHEITSDDDDDCIMTNDDNDSTNSSTNESNSETPHQNNKTDKEVMHQEEEDEEDDEEDMENGDGESDIEEIIDDPLVQAQNKNTNKPIIISDTKSLVDLASKQPKSNEQNKEPTVVIIDTNSIMSGKAPMPIQNARAIVTSGNSSMTALNLCQSIAARGTTITPVAAKAGPNTLGAAAAPQTPQPTQPPILPSLTDDMFVVEAPSFIVPYVYEKPSVKPFREFVDTLGKELNEVKAKQEQERLEKEKAEKEKREKEKQERKERGEEVEEEEEVSDKEKSTEEVSPKKKKQSKKRGGEEDDASWDGESSDTEPGSDDDGITVLKNKSDPIDNLKNVVNELGPGNKLASGKSDSYFDCSLGQFFIDIGVNLVQEFVQTDLLKQQNRKLYKEKKSGRSTKATEMAINSLTQNLKFSKKTNSPFTLVQQKCEFCSFKTESSLVMSHHLEAPHMRNNVYKCNKCEFEIRSPHDILFHMEAEHNSRGRLERAPAYQQCVNCMFEDNSKSKLARHLLACAKKYRPESNLAPPLEWEPPAKIPKLSRARAALPAMHGMQAGLPRGPPGAGAVGHLGRPVGVMPGLLRPRGRPPMHMHPRALHQPLPGAPLVRGGLMIMHNSHSAAANYPLAGAGAAHAAQATPKISITPLPRTASAAAAAAAAAGAGAGVPGAPGAPANKGTFVICEICDGYIKDLEQLRNHMQWIHKVKIHPKMIYNRPPLNCQKCQFRFFTDQGLERHLLGSHGLVTSSMQEAANKGKDAGRCPVCGRVYQWKLLNHVARDHNMTLKPAHLSYKCTVCTATFGMYKQFENHVYSAHSVVAKRVMDKSKPAGPTAGPTAGPGAAAPAESLLKPIKINDEITIIPQPAKAIATSSKDK